MARRNRGAPARALARAEALLSSLVAATLRPGLTKNQRTSLETCITVHMHQKEATGARGFFFSFLFFFFFCARRNRKNSKFFKNSKTHFFFKTTTEELVRKRVRDPSDFEWLKQVRVYWRAEAGVVTSICDANFDYSYEYLGERKKKTESFFFLFFFSFGLFFSLFLSLHFPPFSLPPSLPSSLPLFSQKPKKASRSASS